MNSILGVRQLEVEIIAPTIPKNDLFLQVLLKAKRENRRTAFPLFNVRKGGLEPPRA
jgi:hypothetical protein